ncbi:MAG TPA: TonB-dependent receptor, partial [Kofleriaceae bacterium]|nr:TonB-dependent receptor [Kofleriaceae bacterium]
MTTFRRAVVSLGVATALLLVCPQAHAQTSTTGALQGVAREAGTRDLLAGVLVVATSPALLGEQTTMTDDRGGFKITSLPPGKYLVTFHYAGVAVKFRDVNVGLNHTTAVYATIDLDTAGATYEFDGNAPVLDPTQSKHVYLIGREMLDNGVIPGLDLEATFGSVPGTSNDGVGTAFSGSSSPESRITIDGMDTTGLSYGTVGTSLLNDFIEEIEIVTGGYNAEYGRSTGAVISAVTRSGSNELRGSVFSRVSPGMLSAGRAITPSESSSIDAEAKVEYLADIGIELGGPIIRDRLWFYTGFAPRAASTRIDRITKRLTDCRMTLADGTLSECDPDRYGDGSPDEDPDTGFRIFEILDRERLRSSSTELPFVAKLNWAPAAEHQGQVSFIGTPASGVNVGIAGSPSATRFDYRQLTTDLSAKWTSKLDDNRTELSTVVGWHRSAVRADSIHDEFNDTPRETFRGLSLSSLSALGFESAATTRGCTDGGGDDPYPFIENCPQDLGYSVGGPGTIVDQTEERMSVRVDASRRVELAGDHVVKAGIDLEDNRLDHLRKISGGAVYDNLGSTIMATRWVEVAPPGVTDGYEQECGEGGLGGETRACRFLDEDRVLGRTLNWAAYLRDSWQPTPNLTFNYGLRYEEQRLRYAADLQDTVDPFTGSVRGKNAMLLTGMVSPRAGVAYDWTKEGKSRAYAHWGRFFESIPMDINNRSFGGETTYQASYDAATQCGPAGAAGTPEGRRCEGPPASGETLFGSGVLIAPGVGAQYMDEILFGLEYELMEDLKIGLSVQHRSIGRVLEDLSVDNADTYILANPGEWSADAERDLENLIANTSD